MSPILLMIQFIGLAYALVGGVFLAFSDFIMRSLAKTGGHGGVEAMQVINREVFRWVFMVLFLGLALVSLILVIYGTFGVGGWFGRMIALSGLVYLIGVFAVTVFFNVPMNEALEKMDAPNTETRNYWLKVYVPNWTLWNSVRAAACAASAALLAAGVNLVHQA